MDNRRADRPPHRGCGGHPIVADHHKAELAANAALLAAASRLPAWTRMGRWPCLRAAPRTPPQRLQHRSMSGPDRVRAVPVRRRPDVGRCENRQEGAETAGVRTSLPLGALADRPAGRDSARPAWQAPDIAAASAWHRSRGAPRSISTGQPRSLRGRHQGNRIPGRREPVCRG